MKCPRCGEDTGRKVMYMGFPMKLCFTESCSCLWGFWSFLLALFPWTLNGYWTFVGYEKYWPALWYWIRYGTDSLPEKPQR